MTRARTQPVRDSAEQPILVLRRRFDAPRERVFRAWTDPDEVAKWWGPDRFTVPLCQMDVREGGTWRTCMRSPDGEEHFVGGVYREVRPPERLVFTWAWEQGALDGHETLVTVEFNEAGGGTEIVLTQAGFATAEQCEQHNNGWTSSLDHRLARRF